MNNQEMLEKVLQLRGIIGEMEIMLRHLIEEERGGSKPLPPLWHKEKGVISFSVTSRGLTGENWIEYLEESGCRLGSYAKQVLRSPRFTPTSGVTTEVAVLCGHLFKDQNRITKKIRAEATLRNLEPPNAEVACLIREKFTDEEIEAMGLWLIVTMHEPVSDSGGNPLLLGADCVIGSRWLGAYDDRPGSRWGRDFGFAFAASQSSSQS